MRWFIPASLALVLSGCDLQARSSGPGSASRVFIISIDGLRPDLLLRAETPNLRELMQSGCFTFFARSLDYPMTLPSHASMLTGVLPEKHGIWSNYDYYYEDMPRLRRPTILDIAKAAGRITAVAVGKPKFKVLASANSVDYSYIPDLYAQDFQVAQQASRIIRQHRPHVMFIHLPGVDAAGHGAGWGTDSQLQAVQQADAAIGLIVSALRQARLLDSSAIIVSADHGGTGWSHWRQDARTQLIPWIAAGPGIKQNFDLTRRSELDVHTCDTFATACYLLKLTPPPDIDGKPIYQILVCEEAGLPLRQFSQPAWEDPDLNGDSLLDPGSPDVPPTRPATDPPYALPHSRPVF